MPPLGTVFIDGGNLTANQWVTSSTPETVVTFEDFNFQFHCNVTNDHLAGILPLISPANTLDVQTSLQSSIYLIAFKLYSSSIQSYCQGTIQSDEITPEIHHKNIQKNSTKPFRHSIHCPRMIKIKTGSIFWRLLFLPLEGETPSVLGLAWALSCLLWEPGNGNISMKGWVSISEFAGNIASKNWLVGTKY